MIPNFIFSFFFLVEEREWVAGFRLRKKKVVVEKDLNYQNVKFLCQNISYNEGS